MQWINHRYGMYDPDHRWRQTHLAICYNDDCLARSDRRQQLAERIFGFRNLRDRKFDPPVARGDTETRQLAQVELPGHCTRLQDLPPEHPAVQYMVGSRGSSRKLLAHYGVSWCSQANPQYRQAQDRIIVPIVMHGLMVGWQGRYLGDPDFKAAGIPKYYSMPGMARRQILYNYDVAKNYPFVVVTEGVTDVWATGPWSVALLGKSMSSIQERTLVLAWINKPVILMLDGGDEEEGAMQQMVAQLLTRGQSYRGAVGYVRLPNGYDPGGYPQATLLNIIYSAAQQQGIVLPDRGSLIAQTALA